MKGAIVFPFLAFVLALPPAAGADGGAVAAAPGSGTRRSDAVVRVTSESTGPAADGQQTITIKVAMDKSREWHIYAHTLPAEFPGVPTTVTVERLKPEQVHVDYPEGRLVKDATLGDYHVYEHELAIKVSVRRAAGDRGPLELNVKFQACWESQNGGQCLLPATVKLTVP